MCSDPPNTAVLYSSSAPDAARASHGPSKDSVSSSASSMQVVRLLDGINRGRCRHALAVESSLEPPAAELMGLGRESADSKDDEQWSPLQSLPATTATQQRRVLPITVRTRSRGRRCCEAAWKHSPQGTRRLNRSLAEGRGVRGGSQNGGGSRAVSCVSAYTQWRRLQARGWAAAGVKKTTKRCASRVDCLPRNSMWLCREDCCSPSKENRHTRRQADSSDRQASDYDDCASLLCRQANTSNDGTLGGLSSVVHSVRTPPQPHQLCAHLCCCCHCECHCLRLQAAARL